MPVEDYICTDKYDGYLLLEGTNGNNIVADYVNEKNCTVPVISAGSIVFLMNEKASSEEGEYSQLVSPYETIPVRVVKVFGGGCCSKCSGPCTCKTPTVCRYKLCDIVKGIANKFTEFRNSILNRRMCGICGEQGSCKSICSLVGYLKQKNCVTPQNQFCDPIPYHKRKSLLGLLQSQSHACQCQACRQKSCKQEPCRQESCKQEQQQPSSMCNQKPFCAGTDTLTVDDLLSDSLYSGACPSRPSNRKQETCNNCKSSTCKKLASCNTCESTR